MSSAKREDVRDGEPAARRPTLDELKAMASQTVYSAAREPAAGRRNTRERIEAVDAMPSVPGVVRPQQRPRDERRRQTSSNLEKVRRHGTGEHIRARRHGTGERARVGTGTHTAVGTTAEIPATRPARAELTPNTAIVLSELRDALAIKRDEAFNMALERGDAGGSAEQYLQGRTQGLSEALALLERLGKLA